jgi:uncharacterized protein (DUF2141 family)
MGSMTLILIILLFWGKGEILSQIENHYSVIVELSNLRSTKGKILISIYDDPGTFPKDEKMLEEKIITYIPGNKMRIHFDSLSLGTYAIAALHDENGDEKMNFNLLGLPKEGYCFSNNVRPSLRRPTWDEAKFEIRKNTTRIYIEMKY